MIGISIAAKWEWEAAIRYFNKDAETLEKYPYGEFFRVQLNGKDCIIFHCGVRKVAAAGACQYMILKYNLEKIVVAGTCAGIDNKYNELDVFIPNRAVQSDCTVKEIEPLFKEKFIIDFDLSKYNFEYKTGIISTADKAVVMWDDFLELKENNVTIADTESAAIAYICKMNNIECVIVKGISDFAINEKYTDKKTSNNEQLNIYIENTPKVMRKIFDEYLEKLI